MVVQAHPPPMELHRDQVTMLDQVTTVLQLTMHHRSHHTTAHPPPMAVQAHPPPITVQAHPPPIIVQAHPPPMTVQVHPPPMTVQAHPPPIIVSNHHSPKESYQHPHKYHMEVFKLFNLPLPRVLTTLLLQPRVLTTLLLQPKVAQSNQVVIPMDLQQLQLKVPTILQLLQAVQSNQVVIPMVPQQLQLKVLTILQVRRLPPHLSSQPTQWPRLNLTTENNGNK